MAANVPPRPVLDHLPDLETLRLELRGAVSDSLDRSLNSSAKFAAELVAALPRPAASRTAARRPPASSDAGPVASTSANTLDFDQHQRPPPSSTHTPLAGSPHVHFRTSTPVKTTPGGGGLSTPAGESSNRWSGSAVALSTAAAARPRDSFGSVLSIGGGPSSPVVAAIEEEEDEGDKSMHGNSASTAAAAGTQGAADLQALRAEWRARDEDEQDLHLLAQTYMRNHELLRAAHVLRDCTGPKARWTRCYARYMVRLPSSFSFRLL